MCPRVTRLAGRCYWSRSYIDPYFAAAEWSPARWGVYEANEFIGVVTVDLKLEGIREFFDDHIREVGGYAFLVDQNNKFISYPDESLSKYDNHMLYADDLARTDDRFASLAESLDRINNEFMAHRRSCRQQPRRYQQADRVGELPDQQQPGAHHSGLTDLSAGAIWATKHPLLETVDVEN